MLGMIAGVDRERSESCYRYSVRCDRLTATRIEIAARKAGLTANAFVQQHFETIFEPVQTEPAAKGFDSKAFDAAAFSRRHKVSIPAAKIWAGLAGRVSADGMAKVSVRQLGQAADVSEGYPSRLIASLVDAGLVETVEPSRAGRPGVYRIIWED
jgi:hypothetical protein